MSKIYYDMLRIRMIEEAISKRYPEKKMRMPVHLSIGQEAAAVGLCAGLNKQDKMVSTHRGHAHYLAKGGSVNGIIAELYGKRTGCSRGHGGSMHLIDLSCNFWGSTSIVGGTIPVGVGLAFADKMDGRTNRTAVCIGDAAVEEGVFHESANFAALHKLKVLFFLEDNGFSCYTPKNLRQPDRPWSAVALCHGLSFFETASDPEIIASVVSSIELPALVVVRNKRYFEHCGPNREHEYDPHDPIESYRAGYRDLIEEEIEAAFAFAEASADAELVSMYAN